jgi:hypothetical protein
MEGIKFPVIFSTLYLFIYSLLPFWEGVEAVVGALFFLSPFLVIWLVISVLKDGKPSGKTLEEGYWYEDKGNYGKMH